MTKRKKPVKSASVGILTDEQEIRQALQKNQFVPFFQPIVTLRTGLLAGFEVLARWQHPTKGIILPDTFIGLAEKNGWIDKLTQQILEKAFAAATQMPDRFTLSVNVSPYQLWEGRLPAMLRTVAAKTGFALTRLLVEITESALIDNLPSAGAILAELKAMGCRLSLDDFGTGYSSLHHLQAFTFDELKVDRSFVTSMTEKRESRKIVSAIIGLGESLNLTTVAEGIENLVQAEMMLWLGCKLGQGYFYGKPFSQAELTANLLAQEHRIDTRMLSPWQRVSASNLAASPSQRLAQLQAVYDGAPVGLAFIDQRLRYVNLNKRLADMNGVRVEDHLGNKVSDIIPNLFPYVEPYLRRALSGEAISDIEVQEPQSGQTRLISYQPALDEAGEVIGVSLAVVDISERKPLDQAFRRSEAQYRKSEAQYRRMVELNPQTPFPQAPNPQAPHAPALNPQALYPSAFEPHALDPVMLPAPAQGLSGDAIPTGTASHPAQLPFVLSSQQQRRQALLDLGILDTPSEAAFDDLVALASELCSTPISLVSFLDTHRQWFKSSVGLAASETHISYSFCMHAAEQRGLFVVEDATQDPRFEHNPLVTGEPHIRFYAGVPLYAGDGIAVGALCVIDSVPRSLKPAQASALVKLRQQVQTQLDLRHERRQLRRAIVETGELPEFPATTRKPQAA